MTEEQKKEITKISRGFAKGMKDMFPTINHTGWLIVDPLSGYLNACGYKNTLQEMPGNLEHCQVFVIIFEDGSKFIPAGDDLSRLHKEFKNWMWC